MKARSPDKFIDVTSVKVTDEDGVLSCANLDQSCRSARSCFQYWHADSGAPLHEERVSAVARRTQSSLCPGTVGTTQQCVEWSEACGNS